MISYIYETLTLLSIFVIASVSLNVVVGYAGLLSLVHGALLGAAAYITAIVGLELGAGMLVAVTLAVVGTAALSWALAMVVARLDDERFAVTTLVIHLLLVNLMVNWKAVTRGPYGIAGIPQPQLLGRFEPRLEFAVFAVVLACIVVYGMHRMARTAFSRLLHASASDPDVLEGLGSSVWALRARAFVISGAGAGLAGALYAMHYGYIAPQLFDLHLSILILAMVVVGGARGAVGAAIGAAILILIPELLRFGPLPTELAGPMRQVIFGLLLVAAVYIRGRRLGAAP